jgi:hypothetical protein
MRMLTRHLKHMNAILDASTSLLSTLHSADVVERLWGGCLGDQTSRYEGKSLYIRLLDVRVPVAKDAFWNIGLSLSFCR